LKQKTCPKYYVRTAQLLLSAHFWTGFAKLEATQVPQQEYQQQKAENFWNGVIQQHLHNISTIYTVYK